MVGRDAVAVCDGVANCVVQASSEPSMTTMKRLQLVVSVLSLKVRKASRRAVRRSDAREMLIDGKLRELLIDCKRKKSQLFIGNWRFSKKLARFQPPILQFF